MNEGWNRARCQGEQWHDAFSRPFQKPNDKMLDFMETQEQLMRFSWSEQIDSIVVDGGLAKGVFDRIFHGVDAEKERMAGWTRMMLCILVGLAKPAIPVLPAHRAV